MSNVASLWIGKELGLLEQICINSFLRNGDVFTLFVYDDVNNIPPGVIVKDAREVLAVKKIVRHIPTGSPALHSDLFRYALMKKTNLIWVDLDLLALRKFDFNSDYVYGYESQSFINGAVLRIPHESPALKILTSFNEDTVGIPPGIEIFSFEMIKFLIKSIFIRRSFHISSWPWGSVGPKVITHFLRKTGEDKHAFPIKAFYPLPFERVEDLLKPNLIKKDMFDKDCYAVHLWGKELRKIMNDKYGGKIPEGSFLFEYLNDGNLYLK